MRVWQRCRYLMVHGGVAEEYVLRQNAGIENQNIAGEWCGSRWHGNGTQRRFAGGRPGMR